MGFDQLIRLILAGFDISQLFGAQQTTRELGEGLTEAVSPLIDDIGTTGDQFAPIFLRGSRDDLSNGLVSPSDIVGNPPSLPPVSRESQGSPGLLGGFDFFSSGGSTGQRPLQSIEDTGNAFFLGDIFDSGQKQLSEFDRLFGQVGAQSASGGPVGQGSQAQTQPSAFAKSGATGSGGFTDPNASPGTFGSDSFAGPLTPEQQNQFGPGGPGSGLPSDLFIPEIDAGLDKREQQALDRTGSALTTGRGDINFGADRGLAQLDFARSNLSDIIGNAPTAASFLEGVDLPSSDLSAVLSGDLAALGQRGQTREALARQNLAGTAASAGGLENLRRQGQSLGFQQQGLRGLEAQTAQSNIRNRESAIEQSNAQKQLDASLKAGGILGDLLGVQARSEGNFGVTGAGIEAGRGTNLAELERQFGLADSSLIQRFAELGLSEAGTNANIQTGNVNRDIGLRNQRLGLVGGAENDQVQQFLSELSLLGNERGLESGQLSAQLNSLFNLFGLQFGNQPDPVQISSSLPFVFPGMFEPDQPDEGGFDSNAALNSAITAGILL